MIGATYDRAIYSFEIGTTEAQDETLIEKLNCGANKSHFNLLFHNCADFSRGVINTYYPHATHRSWLADQKITTPKQIAKSMVSYCRHHPDLPFWCFEIAQIPGAMPPSGPVWGVFESFLKSKEYVLPVAALHPLVTSVLVVAYVTMACCDRGRGFIRHMDRESQPMAMLADLQSTALATLPRSGHATRAWQRFWAHRGRPAGPVADARGSVLGFEQLCDPVLS